MLIQQKHTPPELFFSVFAGWATLPVKQTRVSLRMKIKTNLKQIKKVKFISKCNSVFPKIQREVLQDCCFKEL